MDISTRVDVINDLFDEASKVAYGKGVAYSGEEDSLANFKRNAKLLGLTKYQVLAIYMNKHLDAVLNSIKFHPEFPVDSTEGMKGRIIDAINYLGILWALIQEDLWIQNTTATNTSPISGNSQPPTMPSGKPATWPKSDG